MSNYFGTKYGWVLENSVETLSRCLDGIKDSVVLKNSVEILNSCFDRILDGVISRIWYNWR